MVTAVTSYGKNGLRDFVVQRLSAIVLAAYTVFLVGFIVLTPELTYEVWSNLYSQLWMRVFTLLALLSTAAHAWIGLWVIVTDYLTERFLGSKALWFRAIVLSLYALVTITYLFWGIEMLWGV